MFKRGQIMLESDKPKGCEPKLRLLTRSTQTPVHLDGNEVFKREKLLAESERSLHRIA
jgi:hypothetical protein